MYAEFKARKVPIKAAPDVLKDLFVLEGNFDLILSIDDLTSESVPLSLLFFILVNAGEDSSIIILRKKAGGMGYILNELVMGLPTGDRLSNDLY